MVRTNDEDSGKRSGFMRRGQEDADVKYSNFRVGRAGEHAARRLSYNP